MIGKKRKLKIGNKELKVSAFDLSGLEEQDSFEEYEESKIGRTDEMHIDEENGQYMQ